METPTCRVVAEIPHCHEGLTSLFCLGFLGVSKPLPSRPPNVVVIFMDDMAYADIGPFGANKYPTPHLDRMATEGRIMINFYVTQAVCSASRAGLLTGCYNVRLGILGALDRVPNTVSMKTKSLWPKSANKKAMQPPFSANGTSAITSRFFHYSMVLTSILGCSIPMICVPIT